MEAKRNWLDEWNEKPEWLQKWTKEIMFRVHYHNESGRKVKIANLLTKMLKEHDEIDHSTNEYLWSYKYRLVEYQPLDQDPYFRVQKQVFLFFWKNIYSEMFLTKEDALQTIQSEEKKLSKNKPKKTYHYLN